MSVGSLLADYLRNQAEWRSDKADEYDDDRNTHSGLALLDAAEYVEGLPDDDPRLVRLDELTRLSELGAFIPGEAARNVIRLHNFHHGTRRPRGFLDDLLEAAARDASDSEWS